MKGLGIFCSVPDYSKKLADYLTPKINQEFYVSIYTNGEEIVEATRNGKVNTLITESRKLESIEVGTGDNNIKIICLVEDRGIVIPGVTCIYKYNPASILIPEIITYCTKESDREGKGYGDCTITGIYSPVGGSGTTSFSIAYAGLKGRSSNVLYLCMEPFSPISEILGFDDRTTITEAMYSYMIKESDKYDLRKYIQNSDGYDVILPSRCYMELNSIQTDRLMEWIVYIKTIGIYSEIVIELSEGINSFVQVFDICNRIIIPGKDGIISKRKQEIFERELLMELGEKLYKEKVLYIDIPDMSNQEDTYESIDETEIGRWLEGIIDRI